MNTPAAPSAELLDAMDAYWRAANYLSVGQLYLYDNPLKGRVAQGNFTPGRPDLSVLRHCALCATGSATSWPQPLLSGCASVLGTASLGPSPWPVQPAESTRTHAGFAEFYQACWEDRDAGGRLVVVQH